MTFRAVEGGERWRDLARLFEAPGGPKHCWCMVWREAGANRGALGNDERRDLLRQRVDEGVPIGLLAYLPREDGAGDEAVGWCSVAPRETYRERALHGAALPGDVVWSIVCFFTPRRRRGSGIGRALLDAAVREASARGATVIEAYPVARDSPSYRYMGFTSMFRAAGFVETGTTGVRRQVMQLRVAPSNASGVEAGAASHAVTSGLGRDELTSILRALPGAGESFPFDPEAEVWKVGGKIFAILDERRAPLTLSLKCDPDLAETLRAAHPGRVVAGYHLAKRHWNSVDVGLPRELVDAWVQHSYELVVGSLPRRVRDELGVG